MITSSKGILRMLAILFAFTLVAAACGGGSDDDAGSEESDASDEAEQAATTTTEVQIGGDEQAEEAPEEEDDAAAEEVPPPEGTLRFVEFSPVTTFNPAGAQSAQSAYLYPVYDTLTRQNNDLSLSPSLATSWTQTSPNVWTFTVRDDVVFHDGAEFNAQVAVDNVNYHAAFEGNPNAATWATLVEARVVDDTTFEIETALPAPQLPLQMSMVMGMMISPNALDGTDLTRDPQGSGPWIWSDSESQAGATEVFNLNENYWNPADQGVEKVTVTAVPDNNARMNALLTGEADIMATTRDAQIQTGLDGGNELISVPNYFPYLLIQGRGGETDEALADVRVRQAILYAMDLEAYGDAIHAGLSDNQSGIYPAAFTQFHSPELAEKYSYDPERAMELLAEAGYADGLDVTMPIMPAINPHVELVIQMLGAVGISVNQVQINNGELGPRTAAAEWDITWFRDLLSHPGADLAKFTSPEGRWNPYSNPDVEPLHATLLDALNESDEDKAAELYTEVIDGLIDLGVVIPLGHGGQNGMYAPELTGVTMGLNMQAPMPYGVRLGG